MKKKQTPGERIRDWWAKHAWIRNSDLLAKRIDQTIKREVRKALKGTVK